MRFGQRLASNRGGLRDLTRSRSRPAVPWRCSSTSTCDGRGPCSWTTSATPAATARTAALLALRFGRPLVPVFTHRLPEPFRFEIEVGDPIFPDLEAPRPRVEIHRLLSEATAARRAPGARDARELALDPPALEDAPRGPCPSDAEAGAGGGIVIRDVAALLPRFRGLKIAVIGDMVADQYVFTEPMRLSREAPVLVVRHQVTRMIPGGAANALNNLHALGARRPSDRNRGRRRRRRGASASSSRTRGIPTDGLATVAGARTVSKTRILAGDPNRSKQQLLRIDHEPEKAPDAAAIGAVRDRVRTIVPQMDAVILSDYGYELVTGRRRRGRAVGVPRTRHDGGLAVPDPRLPRSHRRDAERERGRGGDRDPDQRHGLARGRGPEAPRGSRAEGAPAHAREPGDGALRARQGRASTSRRREPRR